MNQIRNEIANRFKEFIFKYDLSSKDISKGTGFSTQKVTDLRIGKQNITLEMALKLEKDFNINPCWLLLGRGNMIGDSANVIESECNDSKTIEVLKEIIIKISTNKNELLDA